MAPPPCIMYVKFMVVPPTIATNTAVMSLMHQVVPRNRLYKFLIRSPVVKQLLSIVLIMMLAVVAAAVQPGQMIQSTLIVLINKNGCMITPVVRHVMTIWCRCWRRPCG